MAFSPIAPAKGSGNQKLAQDDGQVCRPQSDRGRHSQHYTLRHTTPSSFPVRPCSAEIVGCVFLRAPCCAKRASRCACLAQQTRGRAIFEPDLRHAFIDQHLIDLICSSQAERSVHPPWWRFTPHSSTSRIRKHRSTNSRRWSQVSLGIPFRRGYSLRRSWCDRHLRISGCVGFLHAVGVGGESDRDSDDSESPAIAVHLLPRGISQRSLLTNASAQHNTRRNCSENSDFHVRPPSACIGGYARSLDQAAGVFLVGRHGLDTQPRTASSKNRAAAQVTYG